MINKLNKDFFKFIIKLTSFIFLLLILVNLIQYVIYSIFIDNFYNDTNSFYWVTKLKNSPKILLMGSSTVHCGLNPKYITRFSNYKDGEILNLGVDAGDPLINFYSYKSIEKFLPKLEIVFYGLEPWMFSELFYHRNSSILPVRWNFIQRLFIIKNFLKKNKYTVLRAVLGGDPFFCIRVALNNYISNEKSIKNFTIPENFGTWTVTGTAPNFRFPASFMFAYRYFSFSEQYLTYFKKLKNELEKRNVKLILLLLPIHSEFFKDYSKNCMKIDNDFINKINFYLGKNYIIGSYKDIPEQYNDKFFADYYHLKQDGQFYYSKLFVNHINNVKNLTRNFLQNTFKY